MLSSLSISSPGGEAITVKFNFGLGKRGGGESSGNGDVQVACLLFRLEEESTSELFFVGRNRERHGLTTDNSPNRDIANSEDTGPLLEILFW